MGEVQMKHAELNLHRLDLKPTILFVATTPFAVNPFLSAHLVALSGKYKVVLCVNVEAYELIPSLADSVKVVHIPFARKMNPLRDLINLFQLLTLVGHVKPLSIHSITPKAGLLAMLAGYLRRVPNRWHTFTGQVWVTRKGWSRFLLKALDRLIVTLATKVFADSESQWRFLVVAGLVDRDGIGMLGAGSIAGVDLQRFKVDPIARRRLRQQMGSVEEACVFIFVGRLARDKGVFDLVQAFKKVADKGESVELWMVGPDEEGLLSSLQHAGSGCMAPIRWPGKTAEPEKYMAAADVLVLPSYREGFGSVIIEAAACGIPAIAYRIDGVIDAVVEDETGILVQAGSVQDLVAAMKAIHKDGQRRSHLGDRARKRAERDFSSQAVTAAWLKHYRDALGA